MTNNGPCNVWIQIKIILENSFFVRTDVGWYHLDNTAVHAVWTVFELSLPPERSAKPLCNSPTVVFKPDTWTL